MFIKFFFISNKFFFFLFSVIIFMSKVVFVFLWGMFLKMCFLKSSKIMFDEIFMGGILVVVWWESGGGEGDIMLWFVVMFFWLMELLGFNGYLVFWSSEEGF